MSKHPTKPTVTEAQWAEIRLHYEFDPDEPSLQVSIDRAVERLRFVPPSRMGVHKRANHPKDPWVRRGSLNVINATAQRKADRLVDSDGSPANPPESPSAPDKVHSRKAAEAEYAVKIREDAEDKRAEVLARHRQEWKQVAALRQEALGFRNKDMGQALDRSRLAKLSAEITAIQQAGERKAWGLDDIQVPDMSKKTDAELQAIVNGRAPY